jgi:hypothetical protein
MYMPMSIRTAWVMKIYMDTDADPVMDKDHGNRHGHRHRLGHERGSLTQTMT